MKKRNTFDEFLLNLGKDVVQILQKKGASLNDAEDAVQTAFLKVYISLYDINKESFRPWFYRVAINSYIDIQRKESQKRNFEYKLILDKSNELFSTDIYFEISEFLYLIRNIKKEYQEIIILKYYYNFSNAEISKIHGIKKESVKIKLYRARNALKLSIGGKEVGD